MRAYNRALCAGLEPRFTPSALRSVNSATSSLLLPCRENSALCAEVSFLGLVLVTRNKKTGKKLSPPVSVLMLSAQASLVHLLHEPLTLAKKVEQGEQKSEHDIRHRFAWARDTESDMVLRAHSAHEPAHARVVEPCGDDHEPRALFFCHLAGNRDLLDCFLRLSHNEDISVVHPDLLECPIIQLRLVHFS